MSDAVHQLNNFYNDSRRVYTKKAIKHNSEQLATLNNDNHICSLMDRSGRTHDIDFSGAYSASGNDVRKELRFWTHIDNTFPETAFLLSNGVMANSVYKDYINLPAHTDLLSKILNLGISMFPMPVPQQVDPNLRTKDLIETAKTWETSEKRRYFLASLHEAWMATPVKNIRKIVAFGLGPLYTEEAEASPDDLGRYDLGLNKYRTLLVFDMAHMLANKFKNPVPIIFQDVNCNQQDRDWLAEYAKHKDIEMRFLEDPHALLEVDKYTLVLAHGLPGFNVRSVIVDITKREGGPAGFFCENIPQFTTTEEELKAATQFPVDPPSRRIDSMVEYYGMRSMCGIHVWQVELYLKPQKV